MTQIAQERWRMVKGSERYAVSDQGRVVSLGNMVELQPQINPKGYARVHLPIGHRMVHRLVADAFLPPPKEGAVQINHKNGKTDDNRVINLEWVTQGENLRHAYRVLGRRAAMTGKHWGAEVKAKMSASNKGRVVSEEWRRKNSEAHKGKQTLGNNPRARETICLETGEIFSCVVEASQKMGINRSLIHQSIRNGSRVKGKWHFSYTKKENCDDRHK